MRASIETSLIPVIASLVDCLEGAVLCDRNFELSFISSLWHRFFLKNKRENTYTTRTLRTLCLVDKTGHHGGYNLLLQEQAVCTVTYLNLSPHWWRANLHWDFFLFIYFTFFVSVLKWAHIYTTLGSILMVQREHMKYIDPISRPVCIPIFWMGKQILVGSESLLKFSPT